MSLLLSAIFSFSCAHSILVEDRGCAYFCVSYCIWEWGSLQSGYRTVLIAGAIVLVVSGVTNNVLSGLANKS